MGPPGENTDDGTRSAQGGSRSAGKRKVELEREDEKFKRTRPYSFSVGPKFRKEHETAYRGVCLNSVPLLCKF